MVGLAGKKVFVTHSGNIIDFDNFSEKNISLFDIAHHLTKVCRFGGALDLDTHYSVAQHSLLLSHYAYKILGNQTLSRLALLHDASEAYMGDVVSGLKFYLPDYLALEETVSNTIYTKYGLRCEESLMAQLKDIDTRILLDEAEQLLPNHFHIFKAQMPNVMPLDVYVEKNASLTSIRTRFLTQCMILGVEDCLDYSGEAI